jgi:hypothetical protein
LVNRLLKQPVRARKRRLAHGNPRLREEIHDPYRTPAKTRGPARCPDCGATYLKGRWTWQRVGPKPIASLECPSCRRIRDRYPAGEITLRGGFAAGHADEIRRLVRNVEKAEREEHPLHRIIALRRTRGATNVTTTDLHLPRRIAHAVEAAWGGAVTTHYDEAGYFVRIDWVRDE